MPMIELTYPKGAIAPDARAELLEELATKLLAAEKAPDTEFFRSITWVYANEIDAEDLAVGGRPDGEPRFRVQVTVPDGALSDRRKGILVDSVNQAVLRRRRAARERGPAGLDADPRGPGRQLGRGRPAGPLPAARRGRRGRAGGCRRHGLGPPPHMEALAPLRVVDFSRILAGPFATMMLADLGADVTKVERPGSGDDTRTWGPPFDDAGRATYFQAVNRNKRSVALDLADPAGRERAAELVAGADVVVENFRPGTMARLGLGYESVRETNPGLVYCSITGFGSGAGAELPGYDLLVQALGGLMSITGEPEGEPQKVGVALVDVLAGLFATVGILAAVRHRDRTGEGQLVEVDLLSSLLAALVNQASAHTLTGAVPARMGNAHPSIAPYELFQAADRELVLAVGNDAQFARLCADARASPSSPPTSALPPTRLGSAARVELRGLLEGRLATKPAAEWVEELTAAGVPAGVVNDVGAAFALAERLGLEPVVEIAREGGGAARLPRNPIRLSATPASYRSPPPDLPPAPSVPESTP